MTLAHRRARHGTAGAALLFGLALLLGVGPGATAGQQQAAEARLAIFEMDYRRAAELLSDAGDSPEIALERGRLALFRGDCDGAVALLDRPELERADAAAEVIGAAKGCARATAATVVVTDATRDVVVRLGDDADQPLVPLIVESAARTRRVLERDLGVRLPSPIFIELVRDQFTLAAMTGLPERAAKTTGTIGIAKWGRVFLVSPRAAPRGYPWLDTLAHELTHVALSLATLDRAPLWLQEGIAKRQETRWRQPDPLDDLPAADAVAAYGMKRGLGRPLTGLGPSVAMLPSPAEATVVFAQVSSFVDFWADEVGDEGLPQLLEAIRGAPLDGDVNDAVTRVSGVDLASWEQRWKAWLARGVPELPAELRPGSRPAHARQVSRQVRLGELLLARGHADAAAPALEQALELAPTVPVVRTTLASAFIDQGDYAQAAVLVERIDEVLQSSARWWSLHDLLFDDEPLARARALRLDPLAPPVACSELPAPLLPADELQRALCRSARRHPR